jgi:class 3 adenylate cyclase
VNQVLGDGIIAPFGAPIAHDDHAVRACYAVHAGRAFSCLVLSARTTGTG